MSLTSYRAAPPRVTIRFEQAASPLPGSGVATVFVGTPPLGRASLARPGQSPARQPAPGSGLIAQPNGCEHSATLNLAAPLGASGRVALGRHQVVKSGGPSVPSPPADEPPSFQASWRAMAYASCRAIQSAVWSR